MGLVVFLYNKYIVRWKMERIDENDLFELVKSYDEEGLPIIQKAYQYASVAHAGKYRESGEPYVMHPVNVAYILATYHADRDTICAGLLHDVIEDTSITKEEIEREFNRDVAILVDGVTKMRRMNFSTKEEQNLANTRKIMIGCITDVRIILIKLADRLHNMRTLGYKKKKNKIEENARETLTLYAKLANYVGANRIKEELEDLSLQYLEPSKYFEIRDMKQEVEEDSRDCLELMKNNIENMLLERDVESFIKIRTKNIYGIYESLEQGEKLPNIHDLLSLKIMVDDIEKCYLSLGLIHSKYRHMNGSFKDYIGNPKTNMYRSLHTTVFGEENRLVQNQIRTFEMDAIASFGLMNYWNTDYENAKEKMQEDLKNNARFFHSLVELNQKIDDNSQFLKQVEKQILSDRIYVYTRKGDMRDLPVGATASDFAHSMNLDMTGNPMQAIVNGEVVPNDYLLRDNDRVRIVLGNSSERPMIKSKYRVGKR